MSENKTTIQLDKDTLEDLNKCKLQYEYKIGKRISMNKYMQDMTKSVLKI